MHPYLALQMARAKEEQLRRQTETRRLLIRRRVPDRPADPRTEVHPLDGNLVQLVVRNRSNAVLLVSADFRRPRRFRKQTVDKVRAARRGERLRTVDSFVGSVPPHATERWTMPVPSRAGRLRVVLSLSRDRVRLHEHVLRGVESGGPRVGAGRPRLDAGRAGAVSRLRPHAGTRRS